MDAFAPPNPTATPVVARAAARPRPRLLGQWLVHRGAITAADLRDALALMRAVNSTIGELAVARGLVTPEQADEINALQRHVDGRWGDIAIALGVGSATAAKIEQLAWEQQLENLRLTDALVELGVLSATCVDDLVRLFEASSATDLGVNAEARAVVEPLAEGLSRMLRRVLGTPARVGAPTPWDGQGLEHHARCVIEGDSGCMLGLSVDRRVARALAKALFDDTVGPGVKLDAAVGAFLVLFGSHAARRLESVVDHRPHRALPPEAGVLPSGGCAVELALGEGVVLLIVSP